MVDDVVQVWIIDAVKLTSFVLCSLETGLASPIEEATYKWFRVRDT
jgi:hypothetical protein